MDCHASTHVGWRQGVLLAAAVVGMQACIPNRSEPSTLSANPVITEAEIDSAHAVSAYDAVRKLRPQFLMSRGRLSLNPRDPPSFPNVYLDNMFYGTVAALRDIMAGDIETITYYGSSEAQYKFGRGNMAGAIGVTTKH